MFIIVLISIILYLIFTTVIKYNTKLEKDQKVKYIIVGHIVVFIITSILCNITSSQIDNIKQLVNITRNTAILIFAPLNSIILAPIGNMLSKLKNNNITSEQFKARLIIIFVIAVILLILEFRYIKNFQTGLLAYAKK